MRNNSAHLQITFNIAIGLIGKTKLFHNLTKSIYINKNFIFFISNLKVILFPHIKLI